MREELITSAVILQDPSVAASPLEKRVAFLRSKNLTQEEIDASLQRVGESPASTAISATTSTPISYSPPSTTYSNTYYAPQQKHPELPARDWRDWFIMATVSGGVGYGLYYLTKRYVYPLIAPPTPPQLEADKTSIDEKFTQAFDILDTLKTDTAALKSAEEERKARVDAALEEVEAVVQDLKNAGKRREDESKRVGDEVRGLRDLIPKALEGQKESQKKALEDLQTELKSLKQLVMNRTAPSRPAYVPSGTIGTPPLDPGAANASATPQTLGSGGSGGSTLGGKEAPIPSPYTRGFGVGAGGKQSIPGWQMAASRANSMPPAMAGGANSMPPAMTGGANSSSAAVAKSDGTEATSS
ncbi:peroxisomal membrane anchor protein conserved region-domain-containing protein [Trichophaea hybrida]|nr:peroxisomal membrane anchor protein conserved region-domain-containing protein [Trichophaea hybrida]